MERSKGYAIVDSGGINVLTVSPSRAGAMVNWMGINFGIIVPQMSDERVNTMFTALPKPNTVRVTRVIIEIDDEEEGEEE